MILPLFVPFVGFCGFPSSRWPSWAFLIFWSSSCTSWDLGSELQTLCLCCQWTHQGGDWETSGQFLGLIVMSHWLGKVWIWIWDSSVVLHLSFVHLENRVFLSCGVQVVGATWRAAMRIIAGVGDLVQRTRDGHTGWVLGDRAIEKSSGAVCGLHRARGDEECGFLGWASKLRSTVCLWFGLKTTGMVFSGLASKSVATVCPVSPQNQWQRFLGWASKPRWWSVSQFGPQNRQLRFGDLDLKITAMISCFGPQNQADFDVLVAPQNQWDDAMAWDTHRDLAACFTWKQVWLGFSNLATRLAEARRQMVHVAPS
jgi:hypothetical protein